jgi:hypothetical protein
MERIETEQIRQLQGDFRAIWQDAVNHFASLNNMPLPEWSYHPIDLMTSASSQDHENARSIRKRVTEIGSRLIQAARSSTLLEPTDEVLLRRNLRKMSSALFLRKFVYHESYVINDEDRFCGIQPAEQAEEFTDVKSSVTIFNASASEIENMMELIAPTPDNLAGAIVSSQTPGVVKSRPNTAFIMMQIDDKIPKLEDINNTIKRGFQEFGIHAVRSDEIQHSGIITQKILDEIATSEFLIADLTGERPSVYYEVGYAHALGKRPILYREAGSRLHFDLLVHNVPEYKNVTELGNMLRERLKALTNRNPKGKEGTA